jgi:hypothetical protein
MSLQAAPAGELGRSADKLTVPEHHGWPRCVLGFRQILEVDVASVMAWRVDAFS